MGWRSSASSVNFYGCPRKQIGEEKSCINYTTLSATARTVLIMIRHEGRFSSICEKRFLFITDLERQLEKMKAEFFYCKRLK